MFTIAIKMLFGDRSKYLALVAVEPYARPNTDLTGSNIERVDTRLVDVLFDVPALPATRIVPGRAVDVFIDSGPPDTTRPAGSA